MTGTIFETVTFRSWQPLLHEVSTEACISWPGTLLLRPARSSWYGEARGSWLLPLDSICLISPLGKLYFGGSKMNSILTRMIWVRIWRIPYMILVISVVSTTFTYIPTRGFLMVESSTQVARLPPGIYELPEWSQYYPRVGWDVSYTLYTVTVGLMNPRIEWC